MPRTAIEDTSYQLIKAHILSPEQSPLTLEQKEMFERIMSVARVLDKNPVTKQAVALHLAKYPQIGRSRAYLDINLAKKLFNTIHSFDYDFWQTWLLNDIVKNIERARLSDNPASLRVVAMEHANLIKALGTKPEGEVDPRLTEKHDFYIVIQNNNNEFKLDFNTLRKLPPATLHEINQALFAGQEIDEAEAQEILNT